MRVLMVSDVYFPRVNGVSTSIQTFAGEFTDKGHGVTLIAPEYRPPTRPTSIKAAPGGGARSLVGNRIQEDGRGQSDAFEIIRIPSRYLPFDPEDRMMRTSRIRRHRGRLKGHGYDLVHIHTPFVAHYAGLRLARLLEVPAIESYHTYFEQYLDQYVRILPSSWLRLGARRFSAAQCANVDALVVPSRAMLSVLEGYGVTAPTAVIPTGVELNQFGHGDGGRFRRRHGIPEDRAVLVHVGRLAFEKNIDFLLRMLVRVRREIPGVLLVIAGEGPARQSLESLGSELGLRGHLLFVGYLRNGALEDCYRAGDAFVFASRTETQGLVLLEAMALGIPVLSTAVMGTKEVLEGGKGCLIATDDEADFAAKAVCLLSDPELRAALGAQAEVYARSWSAPALADRMLGWYATVTAAAGKARGRN